MLDTPQAQYRYALTRVFSRDSRDSHDSEAERELSEAKTRWLRILAAFFAIVLVTCASGRREVGAA